MWPPVLATPAADSVVAIEEVVLRSRMVSLRCAYPDVSGAPPRGGPRRWSGARRIRRRQGARRRAGRIRAKCDFAGRPEPNRGGSALSHRLAFVDPRRVAG